MNRVSDILYKIKKYIVDFVKKNKMLITIIIIALICSIAIAIGIYAQVTNKKIIETNKDDTVNDETYQQMKLDFNNLFNNKENEYISMEYDIDQDKQRSI